MSTCDAMGPPICSCLLCKTDDTSCMDIFGADGIASNISEIVQHHFGIQILVDDVHKSSNICFKCWTITENFHNLYLIVRQAESMLSQQIDGLSYPMTDSGMIEPVLDAVVIKSEPPDIDEALPTLSDGIADQSVDPQPSIDLPKFEIVVLPEMSHDAEITIKNEPIVEDDDAAAADGDDLSEDDDDDGPYEEEMATAYTNGPPTKRKRNNNPHSNENKLIRQYFNMNCEMCTESFETIRDSMHHYRHAHKRKGFVRCCGNKYSNRGYALDHLKASHNAGCFRCEPCGIPYDSKVELCSHEKAADHSAATSSKAKNVSDIVNKDTLEGLIRKYCSMSCELCTETFHTISDAKVHYVQEHDRVGFIRCCGKKIFQPSQASDHLKLHFDPDFYRCDTCRKSFLTKDGLQIHIRSYHRSKTTDQPACSVCNERFSNKYFLEKHIRTAHQKGASTSGRVADNNVENDAIQIKEEIIVDDDETINPTVSEDTSSGHHVHNKVSNEDEENALMLKYISLRCDLCPESFDTIKMLFGHFRRDHYQQGYIKCCTKKFRRRAAVLDHAQYHHDPNAFRCGLCSKTFNSGTNLRLHNRLVH